MKKSSKKYLIFMFIALFSRLQDIKAAEVGQAQMPKSSEQQLEQQLGARLDLELENLGTEEFNFEKFNQTLGALQLLRNQRETQKKSEKKISAEEADKLGVELNKELEKLNMDLSKISKLVNAGANVNKKDSLGIVPLNNIISSIELTKEFQDAKTIPDKGIDLLIFFLKQQSIDPNIIDEFYVTPFSHFLDLLTEAFDNGYKFNKEKITEALKLFLLRGATKDASFYALAQRYKDITDIFAKAIAAYSRGS